MTEWERVLRELNLKYEMAKKSKFVIDPIGYTLYYTWKNRENKIQKLKEQKND